MNCIIKPIVQKATGHVVAYSAFINGEMACFGNTQARCISNAFVMCAALIQKERETEQHVAEQLESLGAEYRSMFDGVGVLGMYGEGCIVGGVKSHKLSAQSTESRNSVVTSHESRNSATNSVVTSHESRNSVTTSPESRKLVVTSHESQATVIPIHHESQATVIPIRHEFECECHAADDYSALVA